jgi:hypothetical protein
LFEPILEFINLTEILNLVIRNPLAQMEEEKKEHEAKMKKMETEMEQVFEMKVNEKVNKLKDSESDVRNIFKFFSFQNSNLLNLIIFSI